MKDKRACENDCPFKVELGSKPAKDKVACKHAFVCFNVEVEIRSDWLRTNGVSGNGAAAKVTNFDGSGKKVRPGTVGEIKVG